MSPELRAKLQAELSRMTENDKPSERARFAEAFWRNLDHWEERFAKDSEAALRDLGRAHLARILVTEHPSSPQHAQALREDFQQRTTPEARRACEQFRSAAREAG